MAAGSAFSPLCTRERTRSCHYSLRTVLLAHGLLALERPEPREELDGGGLKLAGRRPWRRSNSTAPCVVVDRRVCVVVMSSIIG